LDYERIFFKYRKIKHFKWHNVLGEGDECRLVMLECTSPNNTLLRAKTKTYTYPKAYMKN